MLKDKFLTRRLIYLITVLLLTQISCEHHPRYAGPLSPGLSMETFHFAGSFKAELYAAEPLVKDPVSMVFDNNGDAYVVEMADANMPDSLKGHCKIVLLKDTDEDGRADSSLVFADGLRDATTVLPWKGGLIVTTAPDILYLKDTNGDGKADKKEVLFSGFFLGNDEAQITSLRFGVDNWIYADNTGEPGEVKSHRAPESPSLNMKGADFRFRLDKNKFERTTGPGQYGLALDDWGHRFFTKNSLHIQQVVIPWRYLHRNPYLPSSPAIKNISDHDPIMYQLTPAPYWRQARTDRRNKKYKENNLNRTEYAKDHFTGASGGTFYGGDGFPKAYYGSIFTGDVSGNLVHRDVLTAPDHVKDPFFVAQRGSREQDKEFLAATDTWFRPTTFAVGPDGYLYVVDMYRQHIETPVSIPDDLQEGMDFSAGSDLGRIYRIVPQSGNKHTYTGFNLTEKTSEELVQLLSNPNRWWRLHAHQLLIERQDKEVIPAVKELFQSATDPRVRIQALYVLEGLDALNADVINKALGDPAPGIRENAAVLAERFPECLPHLEKLIDDSSARVVFQATLSLGEFSGKDITDAMIKVLKKEGMNSWFRTAVLSSAAGSSVRLIKELAGGSVFFQKEAEWKQRFLEDFSYIIGARNQKGEVRDFLDLCTQTEDIKDTYWETAVVTGMIHGLENAKNVDAAEMKKVKALRKGPDTDHTLQDLKRLISHS